MRREPFASGCEEPQLVIQSIDNTGLGTNQWQSGLKHVQFMPLQLPWQAFKLCASAHATDKSMLRGKSCCSRKDTCLEVNSMETHAAEMNANKAICGIKSDAGQSYFCIKKQVTPSSGRLTPRWAYNEGHLIHLII